MKSSGARGSSESSRLTLTRPRRPSPAQPPETAADAGSSAALAVADRLRPVLIRLGRELRREVHSIGVTGGQAALLGVIRGHPGIGVADLAALERTSTPTICAHVDRLEAAGLVKRTRAAESDRRRVGLHINVAGDRVLRAVRTRRTAWLAARLSGLSSAELAAVDAAVEALGRLIGEDR
jgi:DNA-binding MarR family transcriptional regulator